jgi:hypothetical protein
MSEHEHTSPAQAGFRFRLEMDMRQHGVDESADSEKHPVHLTPEIKQSPADPGAFEAIRVTAEGTKG